MISIASYNMLLNPNVTFDYAGRFSSNALWTHPERVEKTFEILYVLSGIVRLQVQDVRYDVPSGGLLVIEPGQWHCGIGQEPDVSFYWMHFQVKDGALPFRSRLFSSFAVPHLFKELLHYAFLPTPHEAMVNAITVRILAELEFADRMDEKRNKQAEEIYEWLRVNASARLRVTQVAAHFGFSPDHLSRLLKKQYSMNTREVIDAFLLNRAKDRLANSGKYVKEIANELEFPSHHAFISFFKYHEGLSPSEFRNLYFRIHMNNH